MSVMHVHTIERVFHKRHAKSSCYIGGHREALCVHNVMLCVKQTLRTCECACSKMMNMKLRMK